MAADPLLPDVSWSWLTDALDNHGASVTHLAGTVTASYGRSFGDMAGDGDTAEVELRSSWTPRLDAGPLSKPISMPGRSSSAWWPDNRPCLQASPCCESDEPGREIPRTAASRRCRRRRDLPSPASKPSPTRPAPSPSTSNGPTATDTGPRPTCCRSVAVGPAPGSSIPMFTERQLGRLVEATGDSG